MKVNPNAFLLLGHWYSFATLLRKIAEDVSDISLAYLPPDWKRVVDLKIPRAKVLLVVGAREGSFPISQFRDYLTDCSRDSSRLSFLPCVFRILLLCSAMRSCVSLDHSIY